MVKKHPSEAWYKKHIEKLYEKSELYRCLVFLSRIIKMVIYVATGISIIVVVVLGKPMFSFENIVYWMTKTYLGKLVALLIGLSLIIYGLERPRK